MSQLSCLLMSIAATLAFAGASQGSISECPEPDLSVTLTATDEYSELHSPNYPGDYPAHSECFWVLKASEGHVVEVVVLDADMESACKNDGVTLFDGSSTTGTVMASFCGRETPTYHSGENYLSLLFKSDGLIEMRGFRLEYRQVREEDVSRGNALEIIIPGACAVLVVIVVCVLCCKFRWCRRKAASPGVTGQGTFTHPPTVLTCPSGNSDPAVTADPAAGGSAEPWRSPSGYSGQVMGHSNSGAYPGQHDPHQYPPPQPPPSGYGPSSGYPPQYHPAGPPQPSLQAGSGGKSEGATAGPPQPPAPSPHPGLPGSSLDARDVPPPPSYESLQLGQESRDPLLPGSQLPAVGAADAAEKDPLCRGGEFGQQGGN